MSDGGNKIPESRTERALAIAAGGALLLTFIAWLAWLAFRPAHTVPAARAPSGAVEKLPAGYPRAGKPVPAFRLVDQSGAAFDDRMLRGRPTILSFAFAHCASVCPAMVERLRLAAEDLGAERARLVLVTLDPRRDTPDALPAPAQLWKLPPGAHMLSGDPEEVERLLDALGVPRERDPRTGEVTHPPLVLVVDGDGRIAYTFNNPPIGWITEGVRRAGRPA